MPRKVNIKSIDNQKPAVDVYNLEGNVVKKIQLPPNIFASKINPYLTAQAVRVYLANQRLGTAATKTRSEVIGSTRKIYKQKGTGRARHGSLKAPIFIGGGIAHGPHPRNYSSSLSQKMKRAALYSVLSDAYKSQKLKVLEGLMDLGAKTKQLVTVLRALKMTDGDKLLKKTLVVGNGESPNLFLAGRNIENLTVRNIQQLNAYDVIISNTIIFMFEAIGRLNAMVKSVEKVDKEQTKVTAAIHPQTGKKIRKNTEKADRKTSKTKNIKRKKR